ncbi:LysR family transcriptional regulator [Acinetobacter guillouiae]|uniref:LysR family transcriptional regulator n=1 Tax=Acinetobacter guillouiae TaxID=106649 RepID=UPI003AF6BFBD
MIERLSLNSLKFFYYVAIEGSVTIAAERLYVTQSAVSRQIKNLEDLLNITLFERKNKSLILTAEGKALLNCCQHVFNQLDSCIVSISQQKYKNNNLTISCEATISMKWLIPRMVQFNELNLGFGITLLTGGGPLDFQNQNIDLAIRRDDFAWGNHIYSTKIIDEFMFLVNANQQNASNLLLSTSRPKFHHNLIKQYPELSSFNTIELDHFYLCIEACLSGLGQTVVSGFMVEHELEHDFIQVKKYLDFDHSSYYLLASTPIEEDSRKVIFRDWLIKEMQATYQNLYKKFGDLK